MKLIRTDFRDLGLRNWKNGTINLGTDENVKAEGETGLEEENTQKTGLSCQKNETGYFFTVVLSIKCGIFSIYWLFLPE